MKYCNDYAALLDLYVDGELSPEDMAEVQAHLDECPSCRAYVDDALAIRAAFPDVKDTEVPDGFVQGVMAAIRADAAPRKKKTTPWGKVLLPLAACCAIVILLQNGNSFSGRAEQAASTSSTNLSKSESVAMDAAATEETTAESAYEYSDSKSKNDNKRATYDEAISTTEAAADAAEPEEAAPALQNSGNVYVSTVYLPADCADFLEAYAPVEETSAELHYELTPAEYETLLSQLESVETAFASEKVNVPTTGLILVVLSK